MREEELREVLLVRAIEETDREGDLIPIADRIAASRAAKRALGAGAPEDALLAMRARALLPRVTARHAFVETVLALLRGPGRLRWLLVALSLIAGFALSALDGTRRIDILSFPLLGLVLWNLAVYGALTLAAVRNSGAASKKRRGLSALLGYFGVAQASRMVARSRAFDAAVSEALARFIRQWYEAAKPLLVLSASRLLHLSAAAVGVGLIAGLYLRGLVFDYRAGWDSTFLEATQVRAVLSVFYQPALSLTGISLPDAAHLATIRWRNGDGENAATWIHLLAATAAVFVVAPRLLLALLATVSITRLSRRAPMPADLAGYGRAVFGGSGAGGRSITRVVPYAYEPKADALARLRTVLAQEHGEQLTIEMEPLVRYGEEDECLEQLRQQKRGPADRMVLLTSLAATPEDENHGALVAGMREWLAATSPRTELVVFVDEGAFASRMSSQGGAQNRVAERRRAWHDFIAARGVKSRFADLSP